MVALACHPSRPIVAACLSDGTVSLWNYDSADGRGSGRFSGGGGGGGSGWGAGGAGGGDMAGSGDVYMGGAPGAGMGSPTLSPPPKGVRGSSKAGRDEKCVEGFWNDGGGIGFGGGCQWQADKGGGLCRVFVAFCVGLTECCVWGGEKVIGRSDISRLRSDSMGDRTCEEQGLLPQACCVFVSARREFSGTPFEFARLDTTFPLPCN